MFIELNVWDNVKKIYEEEDFNVFYIIKMSDNLMDKRTFIRYADGSNSTEIEVKETRTEIKELLKAQSTQPAQPKGKTKRRALR